MEYQLGPYHVEVATDFGPRLTGLRHGVGDNLLATLPADLTVGPSDRPFRFRGGHRVWAAPEDPEITYAPDDGECAVTWEDGSLTVAARPDRAGIVKEMTVSLVGEGLSVANRLLFTRDLDRRLAPWSITQFPYGGLAIVPIIGAATAPLPNRQLVLWPYTSPADPRLSFRDSGVVIEASGDTAIKVGTGPSPGKLGYWRSGTLFVKEIDDAGRNDIPDMGAVGQVYVGSGFCELESVGGLSPAREGGVVTIGEVWRVLDCPDLDTAAELVFASDG